MISVEKLQRGGPLRTEANSFERVFQRIADGCLSSHWVVAPVYKQNCQNDNNYIFITRQNYVSLEALFAATVLLKKFFNWFGIVDHSYSKNLKESVGYANINVY